MKLERDVLEKLKIVLSNTIRMVEIYKLARDLSDQVDIHAFFDRKVKQRLKFLKKFKLESYKYFSVNDYFFKSSLDNSNQINKKNFFTKKGQTNAIKRCIVFEKEIAEEYEDLLREKKIPPILDTMLILQYQEIQNSINRCVLFYNRLCNSESEV
ncbi:hypothetical protein [Aquimarina algicola]|uniref:DUF2383 domain-containing protein n=1 Tax=Aquimarina algicola TaxID=2589995 RepID=A0A504J0U8_9FLAO|nr:hypothetical protein [Aquimarina algicola]TPN84456.1 hypothetical protein FHK87_16115 [Aquimarina algicola]